MWKLVLQIKNDDGLVVNTTILYVSENAFIGQPIFSAQTAHGFITEETKRQAELAKFYMPLLIAYLNYHTFKRDSLAPPSDTAVFFIESFIIDDAANLSFKLSYYNAATKERHMTGICIRGFHDGLEAYHRNAFADIGEPVQMGREETRQALEQYDSPNDKEENTWLNLLTLETQHFVPEKAIEYLPTTVSFSFNSKKDIRDYVKNNVIIALYNAAIEYYREIWNDSIGQNKFDEFKTKRRSFNYKFKGIAQIQDNGKLTTLAETFEALSNYTLVHHQQDKSIEHLVDELLKRCAGHDRWMQDGGRAYFAALKHLYDMESKLCTDAFREITKPEQRFFKIIVLESLPTLLRGIAVISYKDSVEPVLKGIGVIGDHSRFDFTSFARSVSNRHDAIIATSENEAGKLQRLADNGSTDDPFVKDEAEILSPSRTKTRFTDLRGSNRQADRDTHYQPRPNRFTKANFKKFMDGIYRFMASDAFTRIMIGIGIGAGIAIIAGVFVTITFFSGGTFIPVAAAAAGLAAMSGAGGMIATMLSGLLVLSGLGGLFGWLAHKKIEKNKLNKIVEISPADSSTYKTPSRCNSSGITDALGISPHQSSSEELDDGIIHSYQRSSSESPAETGGILLQDSEETVVIPDYLEEAFREIDAIDQREQAKKKR